MQCCRQWMHPIGMDPLRLTLAIHATDRPRAEGCRGLRGPHCTGQIRQRLATISFPCPGLLALPSTPFSMVRWAAMMTRHLSYRTQWLRMTRYYWLGSQCEPTQSFRSFPVRRVLDQAAQLVNQSVIDYDSRPPCPPPPSILVCPAWHNPPPPTGQHSATRTARPNLRGEPGNVGAKGGNHNLASRPCPSGRANEIDWFEWSRQRVVTTTTHRPNKQVNRVDQLNCCTDSRSS